MSFNYDVIIVGAGPIGSTLAYKLALNNNIKICLIDRKEKIGIPLQCAGILSDEILKLNDLPNEVILNEVKGAYLHSPNQTIKVNKKQTTAYIIDRVKYDQYLFKKAKNTNITIKTKETVIKVDNKEGIVYTDKQELKAKIIIASDGANSILAKKLNPNQKYYCAAQFLIKNTILEENTDYVDVFTKEEYFPGFIWKIPLKNQEYRLGIFTKKPFYKEKNILNSFINEELENSKIIDEHYAKIPIYNKNNKLVENRLLLIGDAAGQIKPTTGGGLILGFKAITIAEEIIKKALKEDNYEILNEYEKSFKKQYNKELNTQLKVQKTLNLLSDEDLDYFFIKIREKNLEQVISDYGEMDQQSKLVKQIIKKGYLFKIFPKLLFKNITKIWGIK